MKAYLVGGAVRDALLGLPVQDRDWVVVGSTPEEMTAQGFVPVGNDFPVFLHPQTHEEYALARTERKTARGYKGFAIHASPDVTLEEDLARRDLTINAMAQDGAKLIDPYQGLEDLKAKVLRHVTPAFREDPVRILRVARFAARFADFSIAPETLALMREMVEAGEVDALVPERVWQELSRGLMAARPALMFKALRDCKVLERLLPELQETEGLARAAAANMPLPVRYACLHLPDARAKALRVPTDCSELAQLLAREREAIFHSKALDAQGLLQLLERCDALRKPQRFEQALQVCICEEPAFDAARLRRALDAVLALRTNDIAASAMASGAKGLEVGQRIHAARVKALETALT